MRLPRPAAGGRGGRACMTMSQLSAVKLQLVWGGVLCVGTVLLGVLQYMSTVTLARHELITQMTLATTKVFEDNEVTYWVSYGTAIGAYRDGGVIPHDADADFNILGDRAEIKRAFGVLKKDLPGYLRAEIWCPRMHYDPSLSTADIVRAKTFQEWDDVPTGVSVNIEVCEASREICHNPDIDIYPAFVDGDTVWRGDQGNITGPPQPGTPFKTRRYPENWKKDWVLPLVRVPFGPGKVYAPRNMKAYLEDEYGPLRENHIQLSMFPGVFISLRYRPTLRWFAGFFWSGV